MKNEATKIEIMKVLNEIGQQPTSTMTWAFGSKFAPAIRALHAEGKVVKIKNGWKSASDKKVRQYICK